MESPGLLARSVILVDKLYIVRYIQAVPEVLNLPDMGEVFDRTQEFVQE